jgi:DNA polymerase-3 subunit delta'
VFNNLVGNNQIKTVLRRMLKTGRVPASLIFAGDEGVGKRQFALELAKAVLCQQPIDGEACDVCASCVRASKFPALPVPDDKHRDEYKKVFWSGHPDVGTLTPYKNTILVDAVRDLVDESNFTPYEGKARFFLIDDADKLNSSNDSAANALLKTLEEPAPTTHLILLTTRPDFLLQTIRSRCQILRFAPIASDEIEKYLAEEPAASKKVSPNDAELLARIAQGSIGKALSTNLDSYKQQREQMLAVLESVAAKPDRARLLKIAEELNDAKIKDEYETRLEVLQTLIHDVWSLRLGAANVVNSDLQNRLAKFAETVESFRAQTWLAEIETLRESLVVNVNRKIATDSLFMKMAGV